jgi:hypothetical protein
MVSMPVERNHMNPSISPLDPDGLVAIIDSDIIVTGDPSLK